VSARLWAVIRREYLERVRSKAFIIGTVLGPILLGSMMVIPVLIADQTGKLLRVAVLDESGRLQAAVEKALSTARFDGEARFDVQPSPEGSFDTREAALKEAVLEARLDGYLLLPQDAVAESTASYFGRTVSNRIDLTRMQRTVKEVVISHRLAEAGLDAERVKNLARDVDLRTIRLTDEGESEDRGTQMIFAIILLMILYTSILMWGQGVMTSIIEEKSSRVIEVVASGVPATQLLAGKLFGVGAAGLTQFVVWALSLLGISCLALLAFGMGIISLPSCF
jgi:ABC-2 type transport system permease protein